MSCSVQVHFQDLNFCLDGKNPAFGFKGVIVPRMFFLLLFFHKGPIQFLIIFTFIPSSAPWILTEFTKASV